MEILLKNLTLIDGTGHPPLEDAVLVIRDGILPNLGNFDNGTLAQSIRFQDPFGADISDKAAILQTLTGSGIPLQVAMAMAGFSEEEVALVP